MGSHRRHQAIAQTEIFRARPLGRSAALGSVLLIASAISAPAACAGSEDGGAGGKAGSSGSGGSGGKADAATDAPKEGGSDANASSCTDKLANGTETDVDCGGSCPPCEDGKKCGGASDCKSAVCQSTCQVPTCSDGVKNGSELGVDCGGSCPASYHGFGCVTGTNGSQVCSSFANDGGVPETNEAGEQTFQVSITWNAAGGNGFVDYATIYGPNNSVFNSYGIKGGSAVNICTSGTHTETFELPLGDAYTYKIWHANCVNPNACSGCGYDVVVAEGGPFGIAADPCP